MGHAAFATKIAAQIGIVVGKLSYQSSGLKIRSREKRGMGSNPIIGTSENAIFIGEITRSFDFLGRELSRTKTHENAIHSSSISSKRAVDQAGDS